MPLPASWSALGSLRTRVALFTLGAFLLLFARRFAELLHPQVWDEEGEIISDFVAGGLPSLLKPLNGYFVVMPRLLVGIGLLFPFPVYPVIATLLAWTVTLALLGLIAFVPSRLRYRPLLVLTALLVPSDPEVFGLPLYTFWWAGLVLIAAAFWRLRDRDVWWYAALLLLCGFSSPVAIIVAPLFLVSALLHPSRVTLAGGAAVIVSALAQVVEIVLNKAETGAHEPIDVALTIEKFLGGYVTWNLAPDALHVPATLAFGIVAIVVVASAYVLLRGARPEIAALAYLCVASIAISIARTGIGILDPVGAGPRYFFYPYILEGWLLVQIAALATRRPLRLAAGALLVIALFNVLPVLSRNHDDLDWPTAVATCADASATQAITLPIQYDGHAGSKWALTLDGKPCRTLYHYGALGLL